MVLTFMQKKDFPLVPGEIESIINCGPDDGIGPLLERMYWFLARKSCKPQEPHLHDLWTGLPETSDTPLLIPNAGSDCKVIDCTNRTAVGAQAVCEEEGSFFTDLHSSISSTFSRPLLDNCSRFADLAMEKSLDFRARQLDELESRMSAALCDRKQQQSEHHHHHHQSRKKPVLNAVERARQKEMKELSRERLRATRASHKHHTPHVDTSQDPRLAFRSPNRQRQFKSYTLTDYKRQQALGYVVLGKLGPDSTEDLRTKRENLEKMKEFGRSARTIVASQNAEPRRPKAKPLSNRAKALKFASTVPKPKKKEEFKDLQENRRPAAQPLSELEILEAKYQTDKQHLEAMRKDLEIFLR